MPILPATLAFLIAAGTSGTAPDTSAPPAATSGTGTAAHGPAAGAGRTSGGRTSGTAPAAAVRPAVPAGPAVPDDAAIEAGLGARPPGAARAVWASGLLLGAPYRVSPLGEGAGIDPDPRFRFDAFDCVTLVETAIALGNSRTVAEARVRLDDIRYDGTPDFRRRNHYLEAQWLPANSRKGYVEDVTEQIAGELALRGEKRLTPATWRAAEGAGRVIPGLEPASRPLGTFNLTFLPIDHLAELAPRIPEGTVLLVVREDRPWRPYRVTHLGIVVTGPGGERLLRHASDAPGVMKVRDEPLLRFAARNGRSRAWPVVGVSLWAIRDASARDATPR